MKGKKPAKNFGGRPVEREPEKGKRTHLSLAVPLSLKRRIEQEAAKRGWSVSAEAALRLEQSFEIPGAHALFEEAMRTLEDAREARAQNAEVLAAIARLQNKPDTARMLEVTADLIRRGRSAGEAVVESKMRKAKPEDDK
jgi:HPt (histidine-containing phosphotransfer) domain-containing protein